MRFSILLLLFIFNFLTPALADTKTICLVCNGIINIPSTDSEAQIAFKFACDSIENSFLAGACRTLASVIHKSYTWGIFKWVIQGLKWPTCALLC
ncbi:hypothetical protein GCK72_000456 [Caenorhabditis remanei]|uniref:Saposin B-type domain-containing protein n=1 Tax=Caenorhabditis remanei TaxID=31234 RepID=A0A6A5HPW5_CAERE|nr:hypothetical protein GCK72_000456 [Caenorhabditis remanei]KAF1768644.1 hypothetical protein GCK72_000456 [Caenorhabditis remanei]